MTRASLRRQLAVVVLAAALVGVVLSPVVYNVAAEPDDTVAVVEIDANFINSAVADDVEAELSEARQNDSVKAVVLKMDTPGGAPAASERMYMAVKRTQEEMPVVASVQGISASGGYYTMASAESIYVLPTSITGSVGLAAGAPQASGPVRGPSGPDKRGGNVIQGWATLDTVTDSFVSTVMTEREDRLEVPREEVSKAKTYVGVRAVENGFADEVGALDDAVADAADRAGLEDYQVVTRETGPESRFPFLVRTDDRILAVYDDNPSYGEIEPVRYPMVDRSAIPHVETIDRVSTERVRGADASGTTPNATTRSTGGVGT